jgi:hypothetical protein
MSVGPERIDTDPFELLRSLRTRLQSYLDGWRSLPAELGDLADCCAGLQDNADRLDRAIDAADERPSPRGEAA